MNGNCGECERRYYCQIDPAECDNLPEPILTNYDNIGAMSVEELAKFLLSCDEGNFVSVVCEEDICKECKPEIWHCSGNCLPAAMKWLQQPAEMEEKK